MTFAEIFFAGLIFVAPTSSSHQLLAIDGREGAPGEPGYHQLKLEWQAECAVENGSYCPPGMKSYVELDPDPAVLLTIEIGWHPNKAVSAEHVVAQPIPDRLPLFWVPRMIEMVPRWEMNPSCLKSTTRSDCAHLLARVSLPRGGKLSTCRLVEKKHANKLKTVLPIFLASRPFPVKRQVAESIVYDSANDHNPTETRLVLLVKYWAQGQLAETKTIRLKTNLGGPMMTVGVSNLSGKLKDPNDPRHLIGAHFTAYSHLLKKSPLIPPFPQVFEHPAESIESEFITSCQVPPGLVSGASRPICPLAQQ